MAAERTVKTDRSLYSMTAIRSALRSDPYPPGTIKTSSFETLDNDVATLVVDAGAVH